MVLRGLKEKPDKNTDMIDKCHWFYFEMTWCRKVMSIGSDLKNSYKNALEKKWR